mmetsp:Transcript_38957/g.50988  ORF Transcript_38957/g.50988 Transcript_38957/m.50988 type:complete len:135 (-) Transcript_38957:89-493(-)
MQDSFATDDSMLDYSRVEEEKKDVEPPRMTVIMEEDEEDRATTVVSNEPVPIVKPPVIKNAPVAAAPSNKMVAAPKLTHASTIKTNTRRISNIDRLKVALAVRQQTMHGSKKARTKADSSDDNESSDDDDSDNE